MRRQLVGITLAVVGLATPSANAAPVLTYGPIIARGATPDKMIVHWGTDSAAANNVATVSYRTQGDDHGADGDGDARAATPTAAPSATTRRPCRRSRSAASTNTPSQATPSTARCTSAPVRPRARRSTSSSTATAARAAAVHATDRWQRAPGRAPTSSSRAATFASRHSTTDYFGTADTSLGGVGPGFFVAAKALVGGDPVHGGAGQPRRHARRCRARLRPAVPQPQSPVGRRRPGPAYYSFTCGDVMFIGLDSQHRRRDATQSTWLKSQLAAATADARIKHVFVWLHQSPYSIGTHGDRRPRRSVWVPDFEAPANKVPAVFSGHDHDYQRLSHGRP